MVSTDSTSATVTPDVSQQSVEITGAYDAFSVSWALSSPMLDAVMVTYSVSVTDTLTGQNYFQDVSLEPNFKFIRSDDECVVCEALCVTVDAMLLIHSIKTH